MNQSRYGARTRVHVGTIGVGVVHGPGAVDPQQRHGGAARIGEQDRRTNRCPQRRRVAGPTGGGEGGGVVVEVVHGVDGKDRSRRTVVGDEDEGVVAEVDGGHIGAEGLEAPAQARPGHGQPGGEIASGVRRTDIEEAHVHPGS